ncbi:hypothetical protein [Arthrobacter sp. NPDC093139]|uniref:hypothetical protein n=1 Tax=Arthrobacter sp. NPDC093139 TaxID=3363945 RepID=UPI00380A37BA
MGIGDSIGKAAENAMEDLAGTSKPTDDAHVPEPGARDDDIQVHSSISEGSNAMDDDGDASPGAGSGRTTYTPQGPGTEASGGTGTAGTTGTTAGESGAGTGAEDSGGIGAAEGSDVPRDVAGSAGLPDPDPDELRADPSEGDQDPSTGLGRS